MPHYQSSGDLSLTGRVEDWCGKVTHHHMVEQKIKFALKQHVSSGSGAAGAVPVKPVSSSTGSDHKAHDAAAAGGRTVLCLKCRLVNVSSMHPVLATSSYW